MAQILVTGGAGFIGSHLCEALLRGGHTVVALDNFDEFYAPSIKRSNLAEAVRHPRFSLVEGDTRNASTVATVIGDTVDAVVHLAARAGVRPSIEQPQLYHDVNCTGTLNLLEACKRRPHCRFIFASSSSVYGNNAKVPFSESDNVDHPISPYAATKKAGELMCHTYHHLYGMPVTCLRFFTVYGPRQRPDLAIHKFAALMERGRPIPVFGDGSMMRDFTYVDDIVDGIIRAIDCCQGYKLFNLGESRPVSVSELIAALEKALGKTAIIERRPLQPGDVQRTYADISLAERELGYRPNTSIEDGLARFVEWFRSARLVTV